MSLTASADSRSLLQTEIHPGSWLRDERWTHALANLVVFAVIAIGFWYQVAATRDRALSPDEALHFGLVNVPGPLDAYLRARSNAHPPLFFFALYLWMRLGRSELFLRLLPEAFGATFLWLAYRWASHAIGKAAGFLTFFVLALAPIWLPLSGELRHYSLMLMFFAAALLEFEKSIEKESRARLIVSFVFLYLTILSHYSALFLAAAFAVYGWVRLRGGRVPRRTMVAWAGCQAGVAALYGFLYFTHVRKLRGSAMEELAMSGWLRAGYFHRGQETALAFVVRQAGEVFRYLFGAGTAAPIAFLLALAGALLLAWKRRPAVFLSVLPLAFGAAAGLLGLYPFSGTRHSAYLLLGFSTAIGVALSALVGARLWAALLVAIVLTPLYRTAPEWPTPVHSRSRMNRAVDYLRGRAPQGSLVFADYRTGVLLDYYLGRDEWTKDGAVLPGFRERGVGPYCLVTSTRWTQDPRAFGDVVRRLMEVYELKAGRRFWVIRLGLEYDPEKVLARRLPDAFFPATLKNGDMSVIEVWPGEGSTGRGREAGTSARLFETK